MDLLDLPDPLESLSAQDPTDLPQLDLDLRWLCAPCPEPAQLDPLDPTDLWLDLDLEPAPMDLEPALLDLALILTL